MFPFKLKGTEKERKTKREIERAIEKRRWGKLFSEMNKDPGIGKNII